MSVGALVAVLATASASSAAPEPDAGCNPAATTAPIVGSWFADVYFPGQPFPGAHEATFITFTPGGGIIEDNPVNLSRANSGHWRLNSDCSYAIRLVDLTWDDTTTGVQRVVDIQMTFVMDDFTHFHSTYTLSKIYYYDPSTGQGQAGNPIVVPDATVTTAERLNTWQVPANFPARP